MGRDRQKKGAGSHEDSLCWGTWTPMAPRFKQDPSSPGEETQTEGNFVQPHGVEWVRALGNLLEGLWSPQDQANPGGTSTSRQRAELRRSSSSRSPRNKARAEGPGQATSLFLDLTKVSPAR